MLQPFPLIPLTEGVAVIRISLPPSLMLFPAAEKVSFAEYLPMFSNSFFLRPIFAATSAADPPTPKALADVVCSTEGFINHSKKSKAAAIIVATEIGMLYRLKKLVPEKDFIAASEAALCPNMKKNTLEKVLWALQDLKTEVKVPEAIRVRAKRAIDRMLSKG